MVQRAALLVGGNATDESASQIAWNLADDYGDEDVEVVCWEFCTELPEWVNVALRDQLEAHRRDAKVKTQFMIIYMGTEEEMGWNDIE